MRGRLNGAGTGGGRGAWRQRGRARLRIGPQVLLLRVVRDGALGQTVAAAGASSFMPASNAAYYAASLAVADLERAHPRLRDAASAAIAPAVQTCPRRWIRMPRMPQAPPSALPHCPRPPYRLRSSCPCT